MASSSSSSLRSWGWTYDVFLSFRGEDTRTNFVDHLYTALDDRSIYTFKDDKKLQRGQSISSELLKSIEQSRFAVVVFSRNYADSSWCLDELVKIVDCKNSIGQKLLPVFYDVDPSEVRKQERGSYKEAFLKHESLATDTEKQKERVKRWREALEEAASISGWDLPNTAQGQESQCIKQIVSNILSNQGHGTTLSMAEDLIGIESRMQKLKSVLCMGSGDIRIIGIWGMGGMGKTTVARAVFDECSYLFEGRCFVANVKEISERHGLHSLQEKILSTILMEKDLKIADVYEGIGMMSRRLSGTRVLIVLDDMDNVDQLEALAGKREWFGRGSRIVITTRDKHVLLVGNRVDEIHTLDLFNDDEALKLFSRHAFCQNSPPEVFEKSSQLVVRYAGGLPLPLKVLGSFLFGRDLIEWTSALYRMKDIPEKQILDILKLSFEGLKDVEKKIFLDIACFFKGMQKDEVTPILDSFDFHPDIGISVLIQRCLVSVSDEGWLQMHDLIQEMGWHMAHHTRLWLREHLHDVFSKNTGMEAIEAIKICSSASLMKIKFSWGPFRHMEKLRLLYVDSRQYFGFDEGPEYLSNELRWICWNGYPSKFLPESFLAEKLVGLKMPYSNVVQLWKGEKHLNKLKFIDLSFSSNLTRTFDFTMTPHLEKLVLHHCWNLVEVHPSLRNHKRLVVLDFSNCKNLWIFPSAIKMVSLETLDLSFCSKLQFFPQILVNMEKLTSLRLRGTAIKELHQSIEKLTSLLFLDLTSCESLRFIPKNICRLKCLKSLQLNGSPRLKELPENLGHIECLEELLIEETSIRQLPPTFFLLKNLKTLSFKRSKGVTSESWSSFFSSCLVVTSLKRLDLSYCKLLEIPSDLSPLLSLQELNLSGNYFACLPNELSQLSRLKILVLKDCIWLRAIQHLPSSISVLVAINCKSLKNIIDLSSTKYEWLWFASFANCYELWTKETVQRICRTRFRKWFADVLLESLLQRRCVINHLFSICLPEREIPDWFNQYSTISNNLVLQLPPNWHKKITGFAMCFVFDGHQELPVDGYIFIGGVGEVIGAIFRVQPEMAEGVYCEHIWMGYVSLDFLHQKVLPDRHKDDWLGTEQGDGYLCISFPKFSGMRSARLVYKEDVVKQQQMMIEDTSLSPETWALDYPFCWDLFPYTITKSDFKRLVMKTDKGIS